MIEKGSLAYYASKGLKRIRELSESQKISDKLLSLNLLLFVFILGIDIAYSISGPIMDLFIFLVILAISFIFSLIGTLFYYPILRIVSNIASEKKIVALRIGITILFLDLAIAVLGLILNSSLLINISLAIIGLQIIAIPLFGFLVPKQVTEDKEVRPSQLRVTLGDIPAICAIIGFIIDIITLAFRILKII